MKRLIDANHTIKALSVFNDKTHGDQHFLNGIETAKEVIDGQQTIDVMTIDEIACMLADLFGDECACNYNDNDEWLTEYCKYADTECPNPTEEHGCWKQFLVCRGLHIDACER